MSTLATDVFWGNCRCRLISSHSNIVQFQCWFGGSIYRTTVEQWNSGSLTEVQ